MMYLSGAKNAAISDDLARGTLGFLKTPNNGNRLDGCAVWALDNGCFTGAYPGDAAYLALLDRLGPHRAGCLFVAVPDVVADAPATLAKFPTMAAAIRAKGWPVALVGQDGMETMAVPWELVDWVFIGGSTGWKLGAGGREFIAQARARDKRIHVGRVNSARRFAYFDALGCDSADGTYLAFGPNANAPDLRAWVAQSLQPRLFEVTP